MAALHAPATRTACIFSGSKRRAGPRCLCGGHLAGPDARTPCDLLSSHAPYHLAPAGTMSPGTSGRSTPTCTFLSSVSRARFACCPRACCGTPCTVPEQCCSAALHFPAARTLSRALRRRMPAVLPAAVWWMPCCALLCLLPPCSGLRQQARGACGRGAAGVCVWWWWGGWSGAGVVMLAGGDVGPAGVTVVGQVVVWATDRCG